MDSWFFYWFALFLQQESVYQAKESVYRASRFLDWLIKTCSVGVQATSEPNTAPHNLNAFFIHQNRWALYVTHSQSDPSVCFLIACPCESISWLKKRSAQNSWSLGNPMERRDMAWVFLRKVLLLSFSLAWSPREMAVSHMTFGLWQYFGISYLYSPPRFHAKWITNYGSFLNTAVPLTGGTLSS